MDNHASLLNTPTSPFSNSEYTVGWICAIPVETQAATLFLAEKHGKPQSRRSGDDNRYSLGEVAGHKVVLASLPHGEYGVDSATAVVTNLVGSFPNLRFCLLVGVAGGAPLSTHRDQIHLGDVVISKGKDAIHGGVFQYDYGKAVHKKDFQPTRYLNQPPSILRGALVGLSDWEWKFEGGVGEVVGREIERILADKKISNRVRERFTRPEAKEDKLFRSDVAHTAAGCPCEDAAVDGVYVVQREARSMPFVHFGLVASGSSLMKDPVLRDDYAQKVGALCFEMEAAGIMNRLPCLVIRGICDYSDSHKNKEWQPYAAMAAAGTAKAILDQITPDEVEGQQRIHEALSGLQKTVREIHKGIVCRSEEEILTWILSPELDPNATQKRIFKERHRGTGDWFLESKPFSSWVKSRGNFLFSPGIPGAGKTVLSSIAINHLLETVGKGPDVGIAYVYCNYQHNKVQTPENLTRTLLKQLARSSTTLPQPVIDLYQRYKQKDMAADNTEFASALEKVSMEYSTVYVVVDALDELCRPYLEDLLKQLSGLKTSTGSRINVLATSRKDTGVENEIQKSFSDIFHELEISATDDDIDVYVRSRLGASDILGDINFTSDPQRDSILGRDPSQIQPQAQPPLQLRKRPKEGTGSDDRGQSCKRLRVETGNGSSRENPNSPAQVSTLQKYQDALVSNIRRKANGMFLIAKLQITALSGAFTTQYDVDEFLEATETENKKSLLQRLDSLYDGAMERINTKSDAERRVALHTLAWIMHAGRPLSIQELSETFTVPSGGSLKRHTKPVKTAIPLFNLITRLCVGLIAVDGFDKVGLVHYTTQEYLQQNGQRLFLFHPEAHITTVCVTYLRLLDDLLLPDQQVSNTKEYLQSLYKHRLDSYPLYGYALDCWGDHAGIALSPFSAHGGRVEDIETARSAVQEFIRTRKVVNMAILGVNRRIDGFEWMVDVDVAEHADIHLMAFFGMTSAILQRLSTDCEFEATVDAQDSWGCTALSYAAQNGHAETVQALLDLGCCNVDTQDGDGNTPLIYTIRDRRGDWRGVAEALLLDGKAHADLFNNHGMTPLRLLCATTGNDVDEPEDDIIDALDILLDSNAENGADAGHSGFDVTTDVPFSPLWNALEQSHDAIFQLLVKGMHRSLLEIQKNDKTMLLWAAEQKYERNVQLLLESGANPSTYLRSGCIALTWLAKEGLTESMEILIKYGVSPNTMDKDGNTALLVAIDSGQIAVIRFLCTFDSVDLEIRSTAAGQTALGAAITKQEVEAVKLLLRRGALPDSLDSSGLSSRSRPLRRSLLLDASEIGHKEIVEELLAFGADRNYQDINGQSALHIAAENGHTEVLPVLLEGCDDCLLELKDRGRRTALLAAATNGDFGVVGLLLARGPQVTARDDLGRTALVVAAQSGHFEVVDVLLGQQNSDREASKKDVQTAFLTAVSFNHSRVASLLFNWWCVTHGSPARRGDSFWNIVDSEKSQALQLLLDLGFDVNARDCEGRTALFVAALEDQLITARALIERGADLSLTDRHGITATRWVSSRKMRELLGL
ncbi:ankyrin repeat-containing domain protein [Cladorrhinum sp. PSN332]|nr:ankyrin repeat-containing domain protein [Cladorrhinum sp. PSN332]